MSLEERIQQSVEAAIADLRTDSEATVRAMVRQVVTEAEDDKQTAIDAALARATEDAAAATARLVAEAEAHARAQVDTLVADARSAEREAVSQSTRDAMRVEHQERIESVMAAAREELRVALESAEVRSQEAIKEAVSAARVRERELELASMTRLLESIRGLDGATSLSEVLDALAQAAAREASRAAVLVLRSDRLLGWRLLGFGPRDAQAKQLDVALADAGVLGVAVSSARVATTKDPASAPGPEFAQIPDDRMGLAVPVVVGGRVVAVLYADGINGEGRAHTVPSCWPEVIEVLARHAARCLEALTVQKTTQPSSSPRFWVAPTAKAPAIGEPPQNPDVRGTQMSRVPDEARTSGVEDAARRIARLLLSEIRLYNEPAVDEGRRARNLLSRLGPEIAKARRLYDERVPASFVTRAELFHQELVATLAGGDPAVLGSPA